MRPLELLLLLAAAGVLLAQLRLKGASVRIAAFAVLAAMAATHAMLEGPRWQMAPAYVAAGVLVPAVLLGRPRGLAAIGAIALGAVALTLSAALALAFPVFAFSPPTGPYAVGSAIYDWTDPRRAEAFTADPDDRRRIAVQIWYPATADGDAPRMRYIDEPEALAPLAALLHMPAFAFQHLALVTTNARRDVPVAAGHARFPLVIFSHGRGGFRQHNTFQMEELASRGYVVAAIDHPYAASGVVFPDGRRAGLDRRMLDQGFEDAMIPYLAADATFAAEQLDRLSRTPGQRLFGRLDSGRVGIFGVSMGGLIAAEACRLDARFRACLAMDVHLPEDVAREGLSAPFMWIGRDEAGMVAEGWPRAYIDRTLSTVRRAIDVSRGDRQVVLVPGMFHNDFSDLPRLVAGPVADALGMSGSMPAARAQAILNGYTAAFFGRYLNGEAAPLLDGPSARFPEVRLQSRPATRPRP